MKSFLLLAIVTGVLLLSACGYPPVGSSQSESSSSIEQDSAQPRLSVEMVNDEASLGEQTIIRGERLRFKFSANYSFKDSRVLQVVYSNGNLTVQDLLSGLYSPTPTANRDFMVNYLIIDPEKSILAFDNPEEGFVIGCATGFDNGNTQRGHRRLPYEDSIRLGKRGFVYESGVMAGQDLSQRYVPLAWMVKRAMDPGSWPMLESPRIDRDTGQVILETVGDHLVIFFILDQGGDNPSTISDLIEVRHIPRPE